MILSPGSRSNRLSKRAVCIAVDTVTVYHWDRRHGLTESFAFDASETGLTHFSRYLRESPALPTYILVDIVEEEYRQETIPHLRGSDRQAVIKRKQARLFRGTPYCYTSLQGRETGGRRDQHLLFTALVNPDLVTPWVHLCLQNKIPVAGIYSLAILSKSLLPRLGATARNVLLVTLQSTSGLRQSYFRDQELKISRLARIPRLGTAPFGSYVLGELDKLQRYLNSLGLMDPGALTVYILSHGESIEALNRQCLDAENLRFYLLDMSEVARLCGIQGVLATPFSDYLFAHLLLQRTPKNHYGSPEERKYFKLHQARAGLRAMSFALVLGGVLWSGLNLIEGIYLRVQGTDIAHKTQLYQTRFQFAQQGLQTTPVDPLDIKTGVEVVDTLAKYKAIPLTIMSTISRALDKFEDLHLEEIQWIASTDPNSVIGGASEAEEAPSLSRELSAPEGHPAYRYYQIALIKGHIKPFNGNYREAIATIDRFAGSVRSQAAVEDVKTVTLPLNVGPETSLQGSTSEEPATKEANFAVRVVLGILPP